jgi:hypothetical protein
MTAVGQDVMTGHTLARGTHTHLSQGRSAMEWVSYLAGEPHSNEPDRVSPVLRAFCRTLNDAMEDEPRQRLLPYLERTTGTADDGLDEMRSWMALDWLIRVYAPTWLDAGGLPHSATRLTTLSPVIGMPDLKIAIVALGRTRRDSRAAWAAALGTARAVAWVPQAAGRGAALEVAWSSTGRPAWAAALIGVRKLACDRATAVSDEIAGDAAAILIRRARTDGHRAAAWPAAQATLGPTIRELQQSALGLLDRMLPGNELPASLVAQRG